jgi:hypothetical protein
MAFVAADSVEELGWDFHPYIAECRGTIPEPTQAKLDAYAKAMLSIFIDMGLDLPATASEQDIDRALTDKLGGDRPLSEVTDDIDALSTKIRKTRIKAAAAVCSGSPTIEQITKLPPRIREAFLGYVAGFAVDPTLQQPATTGSPARQNGAVSTT